MRQSLAILLTAGLLAVAGCGKNEPVMPTNDSPPNSQPPQPSGPSNDLVQRELDRLTGAWVVVAVEEKGSPVEEGKGRRFVFFGDRFNIQDTGAQALAVGSCKPNPDGVPKQLDLEHTKGAQAGQTVRAIYQLDDDNLKICLAPPGADRPAGFATTPDAALSLLVLKRAKSREAAVAPVENDTAKLQGTWVVVTVYQSGVLAKGAKGQQLVIKGDRFNLRDAEGKDIAQGTWTHNAGASPRQLDLRHEEGATKGQTVRAVYQLEGDTLKICLAPPDAERPAELASQPGSNLTLLVLQTDKGIQAEADLTKLIGLWVVVAAEEKGKPVEEAKGQQFIFFDRQFNIKDATGKLLAQGICKPDPTGKVKRMDLEHKEGTLAGKTVRAIYQLDENDLKLCLAPANAAAPAEFATAADSAFTLLTLKRQKR